MPFDPMTDVPQDDEQAKVALMYGKPELVGRFLVGIFECGRLKRLTLLEAYKNALLASIGKPAKYTAPAVEQ